MTAWGIAFCLAALPLVASYLGYPLVLWALIRLRRRSVPEPPLESREQTLPGVTVVVSVYNEAEVIEAKLENLLALEYPKDRLKIVIASDGSSDETCSRARAVLARHSEEARARIQIVERPDRVGKATTLSQTVPGLDSEIIVFSDANTMYRADALNALVVPFRDPSVGLACGTLDYMIPEGGAAEGEALYWRYENLLKRLEGVLGRLVVANGSIYAIRQHLFEPIPASVADDISLPLEAAAKGYKRVFVSEAVATEPLSIYRSEEFRAKTRIVAQGFEAVRHYRSLILGLDTLSILQFLLHKVLRWLSLPLMAVMLLSSAMGGGPAMTWLLVAQLVFYGLAILGFPLRKSSWYPSALMIPTYYTLVSAAAFRGFLEFARGRSFATWEKSESTRQVVTPGEHSRPLRILFLSHYFSPETNAPAIRIHDLTKRWARDGREVTIITCVPNMPQGRIYPPYRNRITQAEEIDGVKVIRVWSFVAPNRGIVLRTLSHLSYMLTASLRALFLPTPDLIIATSPQFFCGWAGVFTKWFRRRPFILEVRDAWPDGIAAVGAIENPTIIRFLEWLEGNLYRSSDRIVAVADVVRDVILRRGVPPAKVSIIGHGVDPEQFKPIESDEVLKAELGLSGKFVCVFVGTIGLACGLSVVLRAARILKQEGPDDVAFLMVGDGAIREDLEAEAAATGLDNVIFVGLQKREMIPRLLSLSDCFLSHMIRHEWFSGVIPSKTFEAFAMGVPVILGGGERASGDLRKDGIVLPMRAEMEGDLVEALVRLRSDGGLRERMIRGARAHVEMHHNREIQAGEYLRLIEDLVGTSPDVKSDPLSKRTSSPGPTERSIEM